MLVDNVGGMAKRKPGGWVPDQHGAWAMVILPSVIGLVWTAFSGEFRLGHVALVTTWMLGYFAFFATSLWLKSRRKPRFFKSTATYLSVAGVFAVGLLLLEPQWWTWGLVFGPLTAIAFWMVLSRRERSVTSNFVTILAASLIPLVMGSRSLFDLGGLPELAVVSAVCFGYFFGTVFYVKTLIRERGHLSWVVASVVWHLLWAMIAVFLPVPHNWLLVAFFAATGIRALLVPMLGPMRGRNVRARTIGIWEMITSVFLAAAFVVVLLGATT